MRWARHLFKYNTDDPIIKEVPRWNCSRLPEAPTGSAFAKGARCVLFPNVTAPPDDFCLEKVACSGETG